MVENIKKDAGRRMDSAVENLRSELGKLRTGKASPTLLDSIMVDYYGSKMPLRQVANVSAPEPRLIVIQPWEKSMLAEIEKEIHKSDLGFNPTNDGNVIRIPIPQLTEERRKDLVKIAKKIGEETKIAIRNVRRDANDSLKKAEKNSDISEDQMHQGQDEVQKLTDASTAKVDEILELKEKDIMEV
ncbi:ribosome recycling factor [candidate division KSB1 bacterium]|jgi:ribosome recycling factor|nr:ribosome recycling factor [candidate division KSB1 bacterium]